LRIVCYQLSQFHLSSVVCNGSNVDLVLGLTGSYHNLILYEYRTTSFHFRLFHPT